LVILKKYVYRPKLARWQKLKLLVALESGEKTFWLQQNPLTKFGQRSPSSLRLYWELSEYPSSKFNLKYTGRRRYIDV